MRMRSEVRYSTDKLDAASIACAARRCASDEGLHDEGERVSRGLMMMLSRTLAPEVPFASLEHAPSALIRNSSASSHSCPFAPWTSAFHSTTASPHSLSPSSNSSP